MLSNLLDFLDNILLLAPEEGRKEFYRQLNIENKNRVRIILIPVVVIILLFLVLENFAGNQLLFKLHLGLLVLIIVLGYYLFTDSDSGFRSKFAPWITIIVLSWGAAAAGLNAAGGLYLISFVFLALLFATFIYLDWYIWLSILAGEYSLYLFLNWLQTGSLLGQAVFVLIGLSAGWFYSRITFYERLQKFRKERSLKDRLYQSREKISRLQSILLEKNEQLESQEAKLERYQLMVEFVQQGSKSGYWEWAVKEGRVYYDRNWAALLGYHVDKLKGRLATWLELIHPEDKKAVKELLEECRQGEKEQFTVQHRLRSSNGEWKWFRTEAQLKNDEEGNPALLRGVNREITTLKDREKELNQQQEKMELLLDSLPVLIMIYQQQTWTYINQAAVDITGYSRSELEEKSFSEIVHPRYRDLIDRNERRIDDRYQLKIVTKNGQERWIELLPRKSVFRGETALIITAIDIQQYLNEGR